MPPKGFKFPEGYKRAAQAPATHCDECGLLLPAGRLQMLAPQLVDVMMELGQGATDAAEGETPRQAIDRVLSHRTMQVFVGKAKLAAVVDAITNATCAGHAAARAKPGPKPKENTGDPSFPADPDTPKPRKRRLRLANGSEEAASE